MNPPSKFCVNCDATMHSAARVINERDRLKEQLDSIRAIIRDWEVDTHAEDFQALITISEILEES